MTLDNLYKLIDAGFTKNDILQMLGNSAASPTPEPSPTPTPTPDPSPAPDNCLSEVLAQMTQTLQAIQAANISNSNNIAPKDNDTVVGEYLASIINPTYTK